jgi:hypothetical protein
MMGNAMRQVLTADVKVPEHYVKLQGEVRAWFGRMQVFNDTLTNHRGETAGELFRTGISHQSEWMRSLQATCDTEMAQCWMQELTCLTRCADGELQECLVSNLTKSGCTANSTHNKDCAFRCADGSGNNTAPTMDHSMDHSGMDTNGTTTGAGNNTAPTMNHSMDHSGMDTNGTTTGAPDDTSIAAVAAPAVAIALALLSAR